ncbi:bacterial regulatory helix-turn-helix, lysR family protein [Burkholderia thailandensis MSMB121]|uniref:LysR family transcriptional regulator n=1 Tax=Burkholderia humptydooensis TaxID=430531 RepID=A0A7U4P6U4_9BURK|nr:MULTISPECIES: LysR substrate-binding domain-containing protein [Burkholderia]AGK48322.1 bacterial regulatory helix-turn-helix, lysR family protein [Burkholderia thailandensis MSMB121]ATF35195.1 LysR family transcriptional regulator [Burkholderia thailandensis]AJY43793.1 bacterial regulatory helix-turn-helix, lysR family protein [Burkholderia sp. 2002721687]ALX44070.1 LysR family transcriptional regulator [Burkholderia humptydooensis]KST75765.1 LysR family transcriptional regulator [Burkhold
MFELSQLRCFVAVAEELHFGRAAERLHMTQPPLSRQVRLLEHQIGTELLERTSRSVKLTAAGRGFLPDAARILRLADEAAATARRVATGAAGTLAIGFTASVGYGLLPSLVSAVRAASPDVRLTLKEMVSGAQLEALDARLIDVGLLRPPVEHGELASAPCVREALVLALPQASAGAWPKHPTLRDCEGKPLLMYSPYEARYFHQLVSGLLERADVLPDIVEYVSQIHSMLALVRAGIGAALIPAAASMLHFEGVVYRPVRTTPAKPVELTLAYRKDNDNPVFGALKDVLRKSLAGGR